MTYNKKIRGTIYNSPNTIVLFRFDEVKKRDIRSLTLLAAFLLAAGALYVWPRALSLSCRGRFPYLAAGAVHIVTHYFSAL